jgi:hypothetical protein
MPSTGFQKKNVSETLYVILRPAVDSLPPYRVQNLTSATLIISQQARAMSGVVPESH